METKRFIGNDMNRLYERVRKELGRDAVILRTRTLARDGGAPLIELVAGPPAPEPERLDTGLQQTMMDTLTSRLSVMGRGMTLGELEDILHESAPEPEPAPAPAPFNRQVSPEWLEGFVAAAPGRLTRDLASDTLPFDDDPEDDGVKPLLPGLPRVLKPFEPKLETQPSAPIRETRPQQSLEERLLSAGLGERAARTVAREAFPEIRPANAIARILDRRDVTYPEADTTAIVSVLGPSGSGRTTALMKMALDCADSGRDVLLIAADSERMGAREQIHAFAEAAGLTAADAFQPRDIPTLATTAPPGTCLFVDVPPGPFTPQLPQGMACYSYLALPSHWQLGAIESAIATFGDAGFDGCVLTFTDLAPTLAPVLGLVIDSPLGIAFASQGRDVADGLGELDLIQLASGLFLTTSGEGANGKLVATA